MGDICALKIRAALQHLGTDGHSVHSMFPGCFANRIVGWILPEETKYVVLEEYVEEQTIAYWLVWSVELVVRLFMEGASQ